MFDQLLVKAYDDAREPARRWARHSLDAHLANLGIDVPTSALRDKIGLVIRRFYGWRSSLHPSK
jgi:hypothetical protein